MDDAKSVIVGIEKASHESSPQAVEDIFDGFMRLSAIVQKLGQEKAERRRRKRNERARIKYAVRKQMGIPQRKPKPESELDYYVPPTSCYCSTCGHPPCGWCESGAGGDEEL